jgi:hypothetical protein
MPGNVFSRRWKTKWGYDGEPTEKGMRVLTPDAENTLLQNTTPFNLLQYSCQIPSLTLSRALKKLLGLWLGHRGDRAL